MNWIKKYWKQLDSKILKKYPKTSYVVITKILSIIGFSFFIWITQLQLPFLATLGIVMTYNLLFTPVGYWLTYCFDYRDAKKE